VTTVRSVDAIVSELQRDITTGATVSVLTSRGVPTTGYVVGQHGVSGPTESLDITVWVREVLPEVAKSPSCFVGVWTDEGITYLDVVKIHQDRRTAMEEAHVNGELALYDLDNQESVYLSDVFVSA
jgi:hypothetical protein